MPSSSHILVNNISTAALGCVARKPLHIFSPQLPQLRKLRSNSLNFCKASPTRISPDCDLYDLLGLDSSSDQTQIKNAYRSLQKRCHPDIAGPAGHDMAIILNEAYSVLSDPSSRSIYDKEIAKSEEFRGYTGNPVYSTWFGVENEQRAVFVDEVKCVGCLKCALFAEKTFAIESVYGRARVVGQWADPEHKIQEAIQTCPVDCISIVERSKLAALEFLMSKQPRGNVRVGAGNTGGARVSNIFVDANKFETRFHELKDEASKRASEADLQREARSSAVQAIRSLTNWWYWHPPTTSSSSPATSVPRRNPALITDKSTQPNVEKLHQAAAKRRADQSARNSPQRKPPSKQYMTDEYWAPNPILPSPRPSSEASSASSFSFSSSLQGKINRDDHHTTNRTGDTNTAWQNPFQSNIPIVIATFAACVVGLEWGEQTRGGLKEHLGGAVALELVNSSLMQVFLAGVTWYLIGVAVLGLGYAFVNKKGDRS